MDDLTGIARTKRPRRPSWAKSGPRGLVALACILVIALVPAATIRAQEGPLEINAILEMTGSAALLGAHEAQTLSVVERLVNSSGGIGGRPITFVIHDDGGSPQNDVQLMNALLAKKVNVVIGPSLASLCGAVAPLIVSGPVDYCISPGIEPPAGSYMFTANVGSADYVPQLIRYFKDRGWRRIASLTSIDATGRDTDHALDAALADPAAAGVRLVAQEHFDIRDLSVAAQLARIKTTDPQALIAWTSGTQFGTVLRNIVDAGITVPIVTSSANLSHTQLDQYRSFSPKLYFCAGGGVAIQAARGKVRDAQLAFFKAYSNAGLRAEYLDTVTWDPAFIIVDALRHAGASATPEALRSYLAGTHDWAGIVGTYDFRKIPQRGIGRSGVALYQWDPASNDVTILPIP